MTGMWSLPSPHVLLEISLPESKCSRRMCLPGALLRRVHPNEGNVKVVIAARDAGNQPGRGRILAYAVPTPRAPLHPIDRNGKTASPAREVASQAASRHMLAHHVAFRTHFLSALSYSYYSNGGMEAFLHPNARNVETVDSVRAVGNRSSTRRVLSHFIFSLGYGAQPHG